MNAAGGRPAEGAAVQPCTRRAFLLTTLAVLGAATLGGCSSPNDTGGALQKWSAWLVENSDLRDAAVRLGKAYLRVYPADMDKRRVLAEIDKVINANLATGNLEAADLQQVGAALQRAVRGEFVADTVVTVEGWVLSRTEARLYAAVAMA